MSDNVKLFAAGAKGGVFGGLYCGLLSAVILFINNVDFMDNLSVGVLFFVIVPAILGGFLGVIVVIPVSFLTAKTKIRK